jgi:hypothetical protein
VDTLLQQTAHFQTAYAPVEEGQNHYRYNPCELLIAQTTNPVHKDLLAARFNRDVEAMARLARIDQKWMLMLELTAKEEHGSAEAVRAILEIDPSRLDTIEYFVEQSPFRLEMFADLLKLDASKLYLMENCIRETDKVAMEMYPSAYKFYSSNHGVHGVLGTYRQFALNPEPFLIEIANLEENFFRFDAALMLYEIHPRHVVFLEQMAQEDEFGESQIAALTHLAGEYPDDSRWQRLLEARLEHADEPRKAVIIAEAILRYRSDHLRALAVLTDICLIGPGMHAMSVHALLLENYNRERFLQIRDPASIEAGVRVG